MHVGCGLYVNRFVAFDCFLFRLLVHIAVWNVQVIMSMGFGMNTCLMLQDVACIC